MADAALKYLDFIQATISRMAGHSFALKGWSVTIVTCVIAVTYKQSDKSAVLVGLLPVVLFWGLDSYFLTLERGYRALFRAAAAEFGPDVTPSFDLSPANMSFPIILRNMIRPVQVFIHGTLFCALVICRFL